MADKTLNLLKGLVTYLNSVTAITNIVGSKIYTSVPQNTQPPYIVLSVTSEPWDTKNTLGQRHFILVQAFDMKQSATTALTLRAAIYDALHRQESAITLENSNLVLLQHNGFAECFKEIDGITWQAVTRFEAITE